MSKESTERQFLAKKKRSEEIYALAKKGVFKSPVITSETLRNYGLEEIKDARKRKN